MGPELGTGHGVRLPMQFIEQLWRSDISIPYDISFASFSSHLDPSSDNVKALVSDMDTLVPWKSNKRPSRKRINFLAALPHELALYTLSFLGNPCDILLASLVCRAWHGLTNDQVLWQTLFFRNPGWGVRTDMPLDEFYALAISPLSSVFPWKQLFMGRFALERRWRELLTTLPNGVNTKFEPSKSVLRGHKDSVYCCCIDPGLGTGTQGYIISGSRDRTIRIWDCNTEACVSVLSGHHGSVLCVRHGRGMLVSCSSDCTARIWYEELSAPESKGHAPGSKYIAGPVLSGHASGVLDVAFGEQWIVTSSRDKTLRVWRRSDLAYVHTYYGHSASVNACCLQDGIVASGAGDGSIHIWDVATGQPRTVIRGPHCGISSIILSGSLVFTGSSDKVIRIWDADEGVLLSVFQAHDQLVRDLSYDPERKLLISGGWDGVTRLWNIAPTLSAPRTLSPEMLLPAPEFLWEKCVHHGRVFGVCFNSTRVVSSCEDRVLMVANFGNYGLPTHLYT